MKNYRKLQAHDADGDLSKRWYISYYYLNPKTGKFERFRETCNLNRIPNIKERREALYALLHAKRLLLDKGYSPFEDYKKSHMLESVGLLVLTLGECIETVLKHKAMHLAPTSYSSLKNRINKFKTYLNINKLLTINPNDITRRHIIEYLDYRTNIDKISGRTRNNDLIDLKSLFSTMIDLEFIKENPAARVKKVGIASERNVVYTEKQMKDLWEWMDGNNPYLKLFCKFIYLGLIRPIEITKIQIRDIDLKNKIITLPAAKTKARKTQKVQIMDLLSVEILKMNLGRYPPEYYIFSSKKHPWILPTTRDYFSDKFNKAKKALNLTNNHTMYGLKHTSISTLRENGASEDDVRKLSRITSQAFHNYTVHYEMQPAKDLSSFF